SASSGATSPGRCRRPRSASSSAWARSPASSRAPSASTARWCPIAPRRPMPHRPSGRPRSPPSSPASTSSEPTSIPRAAPHARYGLPPVAPLLLVVGRLNIQKNLHGALRLLAAVRRAVPDAHLCFVGEEDDIALAEFDVRNTGYVAWLRALAADLGLADAIT